MNGSVLKQATRLAMAGDLTALRAALQWQRMRDSPSGSKARRHHRRAAERLALQAVAAKEGVR